MISNSNEKIAGGQHQNKTDFYKECLYFQKNSNFHNFIRVLKCQFGEVVKQAERGGTLLRHPLLEI